MRKAATRDQREWFVNEVVRIARESAEDSKAFHSMMDALNEEVAKLAPSGGSIFFDRHDIERDVKVVHKPGWVVVKHIFGKSDVYERTSR
jgi:hypothetical protein